ncbi:Uncharacterised protein [uncultured archaeon]|nr:Uncharacterised protein [uncultured archaeon]
MYKETLKKIEGIGLDAGCAVTSGLLVGGAYLQAESGNYEDAALGVAFAIYFAGVPILDIVQYLRKSKTI